MIWSHDDSLAYMFMIYRDNIKIVDEVTIERALYVAIGGDGTMLKAMDESVKQNYSVDCNVTSVVGFNAGNLGFLTEGTERMKPSFILENILLEGSWVKPMDRLVLETEINDKLHFAINEFTFAPFSISEMLDVTVCINGKFVTKMAGSGVLVSTATGSTAMAMSAGGAIISPTTDVMQIIPIMSHSLVARPIITTAKDMISISSDIKRAEGVDIHSDGRLVASFGIEELNEDEKVRITITQSKYPARVWYHEDRDFFQVLSHKLGWS